MLLCLLLSGSGRLSLSKTRNIPTNNKQCGASLFTLKSEYKDVSMKTKLDTKNPNWKQADVNRKM